MAASITTDAKVETFTPEHEAECKKMIESYVTADVVDAMIQNMVTSMMSVLQPTCPDDRERKIVTEECCRAFSVPDLIRLQLPIYMRHFTAAELRDMSAMLQQPTWQKFFKLQPTIIGECGSAMTALQQASTERAAARIEARLSLSTVRPLTSALAHPPAPALAATAAAAAAAPSPAAPAPPS
jgi:hypothetical protein